MNSRWVGGRNTTGAVGHLNYAIDMQRSQVRKRLPYEDRSEEHCNASSLASLTDIKILLAKNLISEFAYGLARQLHWTICDCDRSHVRYLPSMDRNFLTRGVHFFLLRDGLICGDVDLLDCGGIVRGDEADATSSGVDILFFRTGF